MYQFLKETYWAEYLMRWLFYIGMSASTHDASAMCLDPNQFLPEADSKDQVALVCHYHTPVIGYLANSATKQY
jgi:hypothetical protein